MRTVLTVLMTVMTAFSFSTALVADEPLPTVSVIGSAVVRVVPDEVVITAAVESRSKLLADAVKDNDSKISQVIGH